MSTTPGMIPQATLEAVRDQLDEARRERDHVIELLQQVGRIVAGRDMKAFINASETVMVREYRDGVRQVLIRDTPDDVWGMPIEMKERT